MMNVLRLACLLVCVWSASALAAKPRSDEGLVLVYAKSLEASGVGHGFVVADGTLVVTARHLLYGHSSGEHQPDVMVEVVSPYLGDACEAQVVAEDRKLDVVLLRMRCKGHPVVQVAPGQSPGIRAIAFANAAAAVAEGRALELRDAIEPQTRALPADAFWSGCPVLDADGKAIGCWNGISVTPAAEISKLISSSIEAPVRGASVQPGPRASEATRMYLWSWALSAAGKNEMSYYAADTFVLLRTNSALGHKNVAAAAAQLGKIGLTDSSYQRALECDPNSAAIRVLYGQFLVERDQQEKGMAMLRSVEQSAESTLAVIPLCNALAKRGEYGECVKVLQQAVQCRPKDGLLWVYLAQNLRATGARTDAAHAFAHAARLMPQRVDLAIAVAEELEAAGATDQAEQQYRRLAHQSAAIPAGHFLLAQFLAKDPQQRSKALEECEAALRMPEHPDAPPRNVVEKLAERLRRSESTRNGIKFPTSQSLRL